MASDKLNSVVEFCDWYFPGIFCNPWHADAIELAGDIERVSISGGVASRTLPRGCGTTSVVMGGALWAACRGLHPRIGVIPFCRDHGILAMELFCDAALSSERYRNDFGGPFDPNAEIRILDMRGLAGVRKCFSPTLLLMDTPPIVRSRDRDLEFVSSNLGGLSPPSPVPTVMAVSAE